MALRDSGTQVFDRSPLSRRERGLGVRAKLPLSRTLKSPRCCDRARGTIRRAMQYPHPGPLPAGEGGLLLPLNAYAPSPSPGRRGEQDASSRSNRLCPVTDKHSCPGCQDLRSPRRVPCDTAPRQQNGSSGRCCGTDRSCAPSSDASILSDHLSSTSSASKPASSSKPMVPLTSPGRCVTAAGMLGLLLRGSWSSGFPIT